MRKTDILGFYKLGSIISELNSELTFISANVILFASPLKKNLKSFYSFVNNKPDESDLYIPFTFEPFGLTNTDDLIEILKEKNLGLGIGVCNSPVIKGFQDFNITQYLSYPIYNPDKDKFIQYCRYSDVIQCKEFDTLEEYYNILAEEAKFVFDGMVGLRDKI